MITARATGPDGRTVIILGITYGNVMRLTTGHPLDISADTHPGFPEELSICIFYQETESQLHDVIRGMIGEETKMIIVPNEKPPIQ